MQLIYSIFLQSVDNNEHGSLLFRFVDCNIRKVFQFLSILSPFFNVILNGDSFVEKNMKEHEIKDVSYDVWTTFL